MPIRRSRGRMAPWQVVVLVAGAASDRGNAVSVGTTADIHAVPVVVVTLSWKVSA